MDNKSLSLPNRPHYCDDVIGQVMQRIKFTSRYAQTSKIYEENDTTHVFSKQHYAPNDVTSLDRISPRTHSRSSTERLDINMPVIEGNDTAPFDSESNTMVETLKQQHRGYMQRYRKKIKDRATTLESDIRQLQERIQRLQEQYQTTSIGVPVCITVWHVVAEYFRLFRFGLKKSTGEPWTTVEEEQSSCVLRAQRDFMYTFMAPNVAGNNGTGVERLLEYYRLLAFYLPDCETRIVRMEIVEDMVFVTTTVQITITANALQRAFPHMEPGAEQNEWPLVAKKLLGKQIVMRGSTRFMWDSTTQHVTLLQSSADLLSSILRLLGDIRSVCNAFGEARITPDCTLTRPLTCVDFATKLFNLSPHEACKTDSLRLLAWIWDSSCVSPADRTPGWKLPNYLRSDTPYYRSEFVFELDVAAERNDLKTVQWRFGHSNLSVTEIVPLNVLAFVDSTAYVGTAVRDSLNY